MIFERMQEIEEGLWERLREIRETKGREYAHDQDTLADFKEVAAEVGITPLQCLLVYVKKHQRAIDAFCREGCVKSESIDSRILDVVVYHALLLGLIEDLRVEEEAAARQGELAERALRHAEHAGGRVHVVEPPPATATEWAPIVPSPWDIIVSHIGEPSTGDGIRATGDAIRDHLKRHGHTGELSISPGGVVTYRDVHGRVEIKL